MLLNLSIGSFSLVFKEIVAQNLIWGFFLILLCMLSLRDDTLCGLIVYDPYVNGS